MTRAPLNGGPPAWLNTALIQCAWAGARKNGSYIHAQFHRIRSRRGAKKAIAAVAASILTVVYDMLKDGTAIRTSAMITSIAAPKSHRPNVWSPDFRTSVAILKIR